MNYLLDRKLKQRRYIKLAIFIPILILVIYFRAGIFHGFSVVAHTVFRPVLIVGNSVGGTASTTSSFFSSKKSLTTENEQLKDQINATAAQLANYNSLMDENNSLKEILGRKANTASMVLASILSKPDQSLYDTLIIDVGSDAGIKMGDMVFALGNVPVGRIGMVYSNSAKVVLFSSPGEKIEAIVPLTPTDTPPENTSVDQTPTEPIPTTPVDSGVVSDTSTTTTTDEPAPVIKQSGKNIYTEVVGRGGGNFEILLPHNLSLAEGAEVTLPGINSYVLGIMQAVVSDPRDSFQKALLVSPVNIQDLKFVQVEVAAK